MNEVRPNQGFTLIEVLVAVLILSVGLLGLAGMQMTGLRSVNDASIYTQATLALNDIAERIRANPKASYLVTNSAADISCNALPNPYCGEYYNGSTAVAAQACSASQLATYDLNVWFCGERSGTGRTGGVTELFSNASATIQNSGAACTYGVNCTVTLTWDEINPDRSAGAAATISRTVSMMVVP